jgi:hypothetical protein
VLRSKRDFKKFSRANWTRPPPQEADKAFFIFHKRHLVEYSEGSYPAQTAILTGNKWPDPDAYRKESE